MRAASRAAIPRWMLLLLSTALQVGCYAPLKSPGIPAATLPDYYRMPLRTSAEPVNLGLLAAPSPPHYLLGPGDILEVTIPDLDGAAQERPLRTQVLDDGAIHVPRLGAVVVEGFTVSQARSRLDQKLLADGHLVNPTAGIVLVEKAQVRVIVLGEVNQPGAHELPRHENDVGRAIAAGGGFSPEAGDLV
jgi:polysaccharide export outer membrane protein